MGKDLGISRLCDAYGALLTEHRLDLVRSYYDYDLSLAEIAENCGITRQAALCGIKQGEKQLREFEARLHLVERADDIRARLKTARALIDDDADGAKVALDGIISEI